ncbi:MAG: hypothetical protein Q7U40_10990, partial [Desulfatirhabdiaceae bacterium]|nr:hypothetical protein [Desulfatirhabdiaceae bacterium]
MTGDLATTVRKCLDEAKDSIHAFVIQSLSFRWSENINNAGSIIDIFACRSNPGKTGISVCNPSFDKAMVQVDQSTRQLW